MAERLMGATVRFAERGVAVTRTRVNLFLESLQLRLRAIEVSRDPEKKQWAAEMRSMESEEIERRLADQPDNPQELIDRRRAAAS